MLRPKITYLILERSHSIWIRHNDLARCQNRSMPQFIGAPQRNFETVDLGIESSEPLAPGGWVNPSDTIVLTTETIHCSRPPRTEESPRCSKCVSRLIF